jgi:hypothetical protein
VKQAFVTDGPEIGDQAYAGRVDDCEGCKGGFLCKCRTVSCLPPGSPTLRSCCGLTVPASAWLLRFVCELCAHRTAALATPQPCRPLPKLVRQHTHAKIQSSGIPAISMTEAAVAESPDQQRSRGPFLMPDGRPLDLSSFLDSQQQLRPPRGSSHSSRRPGAIKEPKQGWTKAVPHAAATSASAVVSSEAEQAEMYALSRVGHRKQVRQLTGPSGCHWGHWQAVSVTRQPTPKSNDTGKQARPPQLAAAFLCAAALAERQAAARHGGCVDRC